MRLGIGRDNFLIRQVCPQRQVDMEQNEDRKLTDWPRKIIDT